MEKAFKINNLCFPNFMKSTSLPYTSYREYTSYIFIVYIIFIYFFRCLLRSHYIENIEIRQVGKYR